jgi:O-methyltransferase/aklanonic acid methyltransferase
MSQSYDSSGTPLFAHFGSLLVDWVGLNPGDRVLDVGAGTGATVVPAAKQVGDGGRVVGVDLAPGMVAQLARSISAGGMVNAEALVADAEDLPFPGESFDVVLCAFTLFFFADTDRALAELRRVLVPGGALAISTFTKEGSASMDRIWERLSAHIAVPPPADDEKRFHESGRIVGVLSDADFIDIEVLESPFEVVLPDFDAWWRWILSMEFREYVERMDAETLKRFRAAAAGDFKSQPGGPEIRFRMDALLTRAHKPAP